MNKKMFTGMKHVFTFSFIQNLKSKSSIITMIIFLMISLFALPVYGFFTLGKSDDEETNIKKIYIVDKDNKLSNGITKVLKDNEYFSKIEVVKKVDLEDTKEIIKNTDGSVTLDINEENSLYFYYNPSREVKSNDIVKISDYLENQYKNIIINSYNIKDEDLQEINKPIIIQSTIYDEDNSTNNNKDNSEINKENKNDLFILSNDQYWILFAVLMIAVIVLAFAGEKIATAIVLEKSSKVMELLLTNVKPMSVVTGKVLAMLASLAIQCLVIITGGTISANATAYIFNKDVSQILPKSLDSFNSEIFINNKAIITVIFNIIIAIVIFILGFIFFGFLAGIAGAAISKMDELAEGIKSYTAIMIICVYIVMFVFMVSANMGGISKTIIYILCILPFTSLFALPGLILIGRIPLWIGFISIVVLLISLYYLIKFVTSVYEYLIYYKGSKVKLKKLFSIAKANRGGKNEKKSTKRME